MHKILDALVCGRCRNTNQGSNRSGAAQARNDGRQLADQTVALEALGSSDSDKNRKTLNRDSGTGPAVSDPQADHRQLDPRSQQHPQQPGIESSRAGPKTPVPRFNPPMSSVLAPVFNEASPPPKRPKSRDRPDKIPTTADNPSTGRSAPDPAIVKGPIEGER
ncbi:hypothetical protein FRB96_003396 [Tulasnella sp. 330]|nr:hypothetical protein FRB96_003396 [Tulasnella sp. 330]